MMRESSCESDNNNSMSSDQFHNYPYQRRLDQNSRRHRDIRMHPAKHKMLKQLPTPSSSSYSCSAHGVHLLIKVIINTSEHSKMIDEAEKIIKYFINLPSILDLLTRSHQSLQLKNSSLTMIRLTSSAA